MLHRDLKLQDAVAEATRIEKVYLVNYIDKGGTLNRACVAKKLSWASTRQTTRPEDMAYCLLGLLDVNMPLLYGEGARKAFLRLQHEFIKQSDDESIFAWTRSSNVKLTFGLLAPEIGMFCQAGEIEPIPPFDNEYTNRPPYTITNKGLQFESNAETVSHTITDSFVARTKKFRRTRSIDRTRQLYLISLNCRINPRNVSEPGSPIIERSYSFPGSMKRKHEFRDTAAERHRCVIALEEREAGIAFRTMASTLWTEFEDLRGSSSVYMEKKFLIKLAE
jgi:hypothetical protein